MAYATQADIERRYPGALKQVGPRNADGDLDEDAIAAALSYADSILETRLARRYPLPWTSPYASWLIDRGVDLALYRATPAAVIDAFRDIKVRHDAALQWLDDCASGRFDPPSPPGAPLEEQKQGTAWFSSRLPRRYEGAL